MRGACGACRTRVRCAQGNIQGWCKIGKTTRACGSAELSIGIPSPLASSIGKTTRACGSAEGDSPLPEREVSSLHPCCPPPQDSAGECDSEAKRRHSQDRGKPCPY